MIDLNKSVHLSVKLLQLIRLLRHIRESRDFPRFSYL